MGFNFYEYDTYIFDCDGVIIDINELKVKAFGKAVSEDFSPAIIKEFTDHCKQTFGISRYVKFRDFFAEFGKVPFNQDKYNKYVSNYADLCKHYYNEAIITPGTINLLKTLNREGKKIYIASGSDGKELNEVFFKRKLNNFFNEVYGSPETKSDIVKRILTFNEGKALFIGDSLSDMKVAKKYNLDFVYMTKYTVQSIEQDRECREYAIKTIETMEELN
jgi:HAD superfamily hydrolase (TIGR01549 family)